MLPNPDCTRPTRPFYDSPSQRVSDARSGIHPAAIQCIGPFWWQVRSASTPISGCRADERDRKSANAWIRTALGALRESAFASACSRPQRYLRLRLVLEEPKLVMTYSANASVPSLVPFFSKWDVLSSRRTHIFVLHWGYSGVESREHQGFIWRCETLHATTMQIANHLSDCSDMNNPNEQIHILWEHV